MSKWRSRFKKHAGLVVSFSLLAAILPVLLVGVTSSNPLRFLTSADDQVAMRLWLEPERVQTEVGQELEFAVVAEYDDTARLIPGLQAGIWMTEGLVVEPDSIEYGKPFSGRVEVGRVKVRAMARGEFAVSVIEASVNTTLPDLPVIVGEAKITVK